jgi:hypothetical protein
MMSWACAKIASGHLQPWISCALGACKTFLLAQTKFRLSCHDVKKRDQKKFRLAVSTTFFPDTQIRAPIRVFEKAPQAKWSILPSMQLH